MSDVPENTRLSLRHLVYGDTRQIEVSIPEGVTFEGYVGPNKLRLPNIEDDFPICKAVQELIDGGLQVTPAETPPVTHASECFPAQGEIALYQTGHYDAYQEAVANSAYIPLKIYVQKASKWELSNPYIQAMQMELSLSDDQVQALFDLAVTL